MLGAAIVLTRPEWQNPSYVTGKDSMDVFKLGEPQPNKKYECPEHNSARLPAWRRYVNSQGKSAKRQKSCAVMSKL